MCLRTGDWARGSLEICEKNSLQGRPHPRLSPDTHTHKHTNTRLCVPALAFADLQLLPAACPAAVAVSWERVAEWLCGCLRPRLLTPVTPIPPHAALLPTSPLPSLPPGPGANTASNLLATREGQGPAGPCTFLSVGHLAEAGFSPCSLEAGRGPAGGL